VHNQKVSQIRSSFL
jgi:hypothetical protein